MSSQLSTAFPLREDTNLVIVEKLHTLIREAGFDTSSATIGIHQFGSQAHSGPLDKVREELSIYEPLSERTFDLIQLACQGSSRHIVSLGLDYRHPQRKVTISAPSQFGTEDFVKVVSGAKRLFSAPTFGVDISKYVTDAVQAQLLSLQERVTELGDLLLARERALGSHRDQLDANFIKRQEQLEAEFKKREQARLESSAEEQARLDAERKTTQEEKEKKWREIEGQLSEKAGELEETAKSLQEWEERLKNANEKDARRQIRESLVASAKIDKNNGFEVSAKSEEKIRTVHIACASVMAVFLLGIVFSFTAYFPLEGVLAWASRALMSAGFAGFAVYLVRWGSMWAQRHADMEFQLKRFSLDIDRANWIVEMGIEYKKEDVQVSPEMMAMLARGLFEPDAGISTPKHPSEQLVELFRHAKDIKLTAGDNALTISGPSLKKADKAAN